MYPTKKEILKKKPKISQKTINVTLDWKKNCLKEWKHQSKKQQLTQLNILIWLITKTYCIETNYKKQYLNIKNSTKYTYNPKTQTIYQDKNNPSIISTLHELAHHLYGHSEIKACRWSIWLFKECFPGLYKNLKWKNHTLIK